MSKQIELKRFTNEEEYKIPDNENTKLEVKNIYKS